MANEVSKDRVLETTATTGTGTIALSGAVAGFQTFAAVGDGNTCFYAMWAVDSNGAPSGAWEVGSGTYTSSGQTLSRSSILASSNSGSAVNFGAGTKRVACVDPAGRAGQTPYKDTANTFVAAQSISGAANVLTVAGSASSSPVSLTATGSDSHVCIQLAPKGTGGFVQVGPDTYGPDANFDIGIELVSQSNSQADSVYGIYSELRMADHAGAVGYGAKFYVGTAASATQDPLFVAGAWAYGYSDLPAGRTVETVDGLLASVYNAGGGTVTNLNGVLSEVSSDNASNTTNATCFVCWPYNTHQTSGAGIVSGMYCRWDLKTRPSLEAYGVWIGDMSSAATNGYYLWCDSPGVYRIKSDGIMAYYNPAFSPKYTAGAVDFERFIQQWSGNTAQYGVEVGGTGTLRPLRLLGKAICFGTDSPNAAANLQFDSTTQGWLPPRMTSTQRDAISSPPEGLVIYNTTTHTLNVHNGSAWKAVTIT